MILAGAYITVEIRKKQNLKQFSVAIDNSIKGLIASLNNI
ncbi:hypothetical protein BPUTEOMOX_2322 [methanotrophic endosymbiont of Bathymodiolus puteoserpentis (Logatchev)]|jgi:hypothetical protein|nr:hypothetical protein BPUTEOMOX_2322 [methanotrophic endosymbiont of Bathymodiolus puteoserpentis (Logatchev)]